MSSNENKETDLPLSSDKPAEPVDKKIDEEVPNDFKTVDTKKIFKTPPRPSFNPFKTSDDVIDKDLISPTPKEEKSQQPFKREPRFRQRPDNQPSSQKEGGQARSSSSSRDGSDKKKSSFVRLPKHIKPSAQPLSQPTRIYLESSTEEFVIDDPKKLQEWLKSDQPEKDSGLAEFEQMLGKYMPQSKKIVEGDVVNVPVVTVSSDHVLVDLGLKSEGIIPIEEFKNLEGIINVKVGDIIPIIITRDEETGEIEVTHRQAREMLLIQNIEKAFTEKTPIKGVVVQVVKSGLLVDIGIPAFMPASQIDTIRVEKLENWIGEKIEVELINLDLRSRKVVVSRRQILERYVREQRDQILAVLNLGDIVNGTVKSIKDFGSFVEVNGLDAFLPRSEISWDRDAQPSEHLKEGLKLKVKIIEINKEAGKITISRKQAKGDPWQSVEKKFPIDTIVRGKVVSLADYGAFVHLDEGITGLIHVSDMHWGTERRKTTEFVEEGQWLKVKILEVDVAGRRISLGLKQTTRDPWEDVSERFKEGVKVQGVVKTLTDRGVVAKLDEFIDGFIPLSDMTWDRKVRHPKQIVNVGETVELVVTRVEVDKRRIILSLKQLSTNPIALFAANHPENSFIEGKIVRIIPSGVFVQLSDGIDGYCPISQFGAERIEKIEDEAKVDDKHFFKIVNIDVDSQKISLSRKDYLKHQERQEVAQFMSQKESVGPDLGSMLRNLHLPPQE